MLVAARDDLVVAEPQRVDDIGVELSAGLVRERRARRTRSGRTSRRCPAPASDRCRRARTARHAMPIPRAFRARRRRAATRRTRDARRADSAASPRPVRSRTSRNAPSRSTTAATVTAGRGADCSIIEGRAARRRRNRDVTRRRKRALESGLASHEIDLTGSPRNVRRRTRVAVPRVAALLLDRRGASARRAASSPAGRGRRQRRCRPASAVAVQPVGRLVRRLVDGLLRRRPCPSSARPSPRPSRRLLRRVRLRASFLTASLSVGLHCVRLRCSAFGCSGCASSGRARSSKSRRTRRRRVWQKACSSISSSL